MNTTTKEYPTFTNQKMKNKPEEDSTPYTIKKTT